jgi:hypothetical protein
MAAIQTLPGLGKICVSHFFSACGVVFFGVKAPLNYSVFVDAAAALLLAA